jgi:hypothetical protein
LLKPDEFTEFTFPEDDDEEEEDEEDEDEDWSILEIDKPDCKPLIPRELEDEDAMLSLLSAERGLDGLPVSTGSLGLDILEIRRLEKIRIRLKKY